MMFFCNQIYDEIPEFKRSQPDFDDDYYNKFIIVISLLLIIPSLYYLYRNVPYFLKVTPKETIIYVNKEISPDKNEIFNDMSSCGGFIPYIRKLHANQGPHVSSKLPYPNTISVVDPMIIKATQQIGDRPINLFKFLEPFLTNDNLQVHDSKRAANFRRLTGSTLGHEGNLLLSIFFFFLHRKF
jgi:hypothetical protein